MKKGCDLGMNYLITGGAGFIGSNFIDYMIKKYPEDHFFCLDSFTYAGNSKTVERFFDRSNFTLIVGDICDAELIESCFKDYKFDYIVNFAAESHVDRSIDDAGLFLKTNILGCHVLLETSKKYGCKRFHQVSTDEVYGDLPLNRPDLKFDEDYKLVPSSPYSSSKASADLLCLAYFRTYNLPVTISRCSNNYGPYQYPEKLIPLMILKAINDEPLPVYGNGLNVRDWIHVKDHCSAIDILLKKGQLGEVYNIGGDEEHENIHVVNEILKLSNKDRSLITFVEDRKGHDLRYAINSTKIERLGWNRSLIFGDGLKKTIEWYKDNAEWLESVNRQTKIEYGKIIVGSNNP